MQVHYRRCKHCYSRYKWRINGYQWGKQDYISDYCPECQKLIDEALKKRPVMYDKRWIQLDSSIIAKLVHEVELDDDLMKIDLQAFKTQYYVNMDGRRYHIYFDNIGNEWKINGWRYYDIANGEFTNDYVEVSDYNSVSQAPLMNICDIQPMELNKPIGQLIWMMPVRPGDTKPAAEKMEE